MTAKPLIKTLVLAIAFLLLLSTIPFVPLAQASVSSNQDKAIFFLKDIVQINLSKYNVKLLEDVQSGIGKESLVYNLDSSLLNRATATFDFYNGSLGSLAVYPNFGNLIYSQPSSDIFNLSLRIFEGYHELTNDSQVQDMVNFLKTAGSVKNITQQSSNMTFRISAKEGFTTFQFANSINNVEYTGAAVTVYGAGAVLFDDSRNFLTIGNTNINISRDQATKLAQDYVKNYCFQKALFNGTKIIVSNLNVTGVRSVDLATRTYNPNGNETSQNTVLSPYWHIDVKISNLDPSDLSGVNVQVSANDGAVVSPLLEANTNFTPLVNPLFPPILIGAIFSLILVVILIIIVAVVLLVIMVNKKQTKKQPNF